MKTVEAKPIETKKDQPRLEQVTRDKIMPSPTNPRKHFDEAKLNELASSIARLGIQQPLIVRPLPKYEVKAPDLVTKHWRIVKNGNEIVKQWGADKHGEYSAQEWMEKNAAFQFELVAGERRWRAAGIAKVQTVPALISHLSDTEVLEVQYIENLQRADLTALEEAEGFRKLIDSRVYTAESLAEKLGKSRSHIFGRLALMKLAPKVRKALQDGIIPHTIAELIGRLPGTKLQETFLEEEVLDWEGDPHSFRSVKEILEDQYEVDLKKAKFDINATYEGFARYENNTAQDLKSWGPCSTCPKRSGNAKDQFPDIKSPNICTDPICFKAKEEAHIQAIVLKARMAGHAVLVNKEAEKLFDRYSSGPQGRPLKENCGYVRKTDVCEADKKKQRTFEKLLADNLPPITVAIHEGRVVELFKLNDVKPRLEQQGLKMEAEKRDESGASNRAAERKKEEARKHKEAQARVAASRAIAEVVAKAEKEKITLALLRELAKKSGYTTKVLERRKIESKTNLRDTFEKYVDGLTEAQCVGLIVEAEFCTNPVSYYSGNFEDNFQSVCKTYGVKLDKILDAVKLEEKEKEKASKSKTKTAATPPQSARKE